jgi:hypothetical protein
VGPEAYTSFGALFKKKNAKLQLQYQVWKWIFI